MTTPPCNKRQPESGDAYFDTDGVRAYTRSAHRGILVVWENKFVRDLLAAQDPSASVRVLDIGTGPGWIPVRIAKERPSWAVTGLDFSALMLQEAQALAGREHVHVDWVQADALHTGLPDAHVDLVISHFSLHELPDAPQILSEVARLLKPGGRFVAHDLARPPARRIPVMCVINWLLSFSVEFTRQYADSLRASYTRDEMQELLNQSPLEGNVKTIYGGSQLRIEAVRPI